MRRAGEALPAASVTPPERRELKRRRKEIERRLAAAGLRRASLDKLPRWLEPRVQARLRGFRSELEALGPLFRRFGRYLSTRLDLLAGADGRELAALPDQARPLPEPELRRLLRSELGPQAFASLLRLDAEPVESLALSQTHRGWLADGRMVSLKLARASALSASDLAVLPHLAQQLSSLGWPLPAARRMLADFEDVVARSLDLRGEAELLARLALLRDEPRFRVPRVVQALSRTRVLTLELAPGAPLFGKPAELGEASVEATGPTRILADLWMRLVFDELQVPEELSIRDVWAAPGGVVELTGGLFHPVSGHDAEALWRYLVAAARDDPDEVFRALEALATRGGSARPQALRHQLGHVVPRRDGRFGETPPGFPELLLSHWQQLERYGLVAKPALLAFYRGLVSLRELTGPALSHGVLREALQVAQISRGNERLRKALDPSLVTRGAEGAVKMLMELPRTLEQTSLFRGSQPEARAGVEDDEPAAGGDGWTGLAAGLLLAATLALWFQRLPTLLGSWTEPVQALALGVLGAGLLRWVWKA